MPHLRGGARAQDRQEPDPLGRPDRRRPAARRRRRDDPRRAAALDRDGRPRGQRVLRFRARTDGDRAARAAGRRPCRAAGLAQGQPRDLRRRATGARQEGRLRHHDDVGDRGRGAPLLRLDRRAGRQARRRVLHRPDHAAPPAEHVVPAQRRSRGAAGAAAPDARTGSGCRRGGQGGRALGGGVRRFLGRRGARRPARRGRGRARGAANVRRADEDQPVRPLPPPQRGEESSCCARRCSASAAAAATQTDMSPAVRAAGSDLRHRRRRRRREHGRGGRPGHRHRGQPADALHHVCAHRARAVARCDARPQAHRALFGRLYPQPGDPGDRHGHRRRVRLQRSGRPPGPPVAWPAVGDADAPRRHGQHAGDRRSRDLLAGVVLQRRSRRRHDHARCCRSRREAAGAAACRSRGSRR